MVLKLVLIVVVVKLKEKVGFIMVMLSEFFVEFVINVEF